MARRKFDVNLITGYITRLIDQVGCEPNFSLPPLSTRRMALNLRAQWYHARTAYIHALRENPDKINDPIFAERYQALTSNILKITPNPLLKNAAPEGNYTFAWTSEEKTVMAEFIYNSLGERQPELDPIRDRESLSELLNR